MLIEFLIGLNVFLIQGNTIVRAMGAAKWTPENYGMMNLANPT